MHTCIPAIHTVNEIPHMKYIQYVHYTHYIQDRQYIQNIQYKGEATLNKGSVAHTFLANTLH